LKPAWANSAGDLILKNPLQKWAGGVAQGEGPVFKPQYHQKTIVTQPLAGRLSMVLGIGF
jgi:hypothetical protein